MAAGEDGRPISYFHIDHSEAEKIFKLLKYISSLPVGQWVLIKKVAKTTKLKRSTIERIIRIVAGTLWADMKKDGSYEVMIPGRMIFMKNATYNKKRNLPNVKIPYRAPTYIRRGEV